VLVLVAIAVLAVGILGLVRRSKAVTFNYLLVAIGVIIGVWAFLAGGALPAGPPAPTRSPTTG